MHLCPHACVQVTLGEHDVTTTGERISEQVVSVAHIKTHEQYDAATSNNDIALLVLEEEVDIGIYTPVCLAQSSDTETFYGKDALVYGWGTTSSGGAASDVLLEVRYV